MRGEHQSGQLVWQDREREYLCHVPDGASRSAPLVLAFHGAGSDARAMVDFCGLSELADRHGFIVVYPQGTGRLPGARTWNSGGHFLYAARQGIDDVGFIRELVRQLRSTVINDAAAVVAVGMSNGAALCYRLAIEQPGSLAAIACIAGCMFELPSREPSPIPVVHFHGTRDEYVPYEGGVGPKSLTRTPALAVRETVEFWARLNGCEFPAVFSKLKANREDGTSVEQLSYRDPAGNVRVQLWTILGGGHTWPGRVSPFDYLGLVTQQINATELVWDFFHHWI